MVGAPFGLEKNVSAERAGRAPVWRWHKSSQGCHAPQNTDRARTEPASWGDSPAPQARGAGY